jgi:hypothetical protein
MGQTVLVDSTTLIDNNIPGQNIMNLVAGTDCVEVNGRIRLDLDNVIQATLIEKKPAGTVTSEMRGFVKNHKDGANPKTLQIGHLTVNYAAALIDDMPNPVGNAWNGLLVEAKGTGSSSFNLTTTTLTASKVEPENQGSVTMSTNSKWKDLSRSWLGGRFLYWQHPCSYDLGDGLLRWHDRRDRHRRQTVCRRTACRWNLDGRAREFS